MSSAVKLFFRMDQDPDGYPPIGVESVWALKRDDGYEIDNIPFYVKEVAVGDIVSAKPDADGCLWYTGLILAGGHSTIQIMFSNTEDVQPVRDVLKQMGCDSEGSDLPRLIAVNVPPTVPYENVKAYLDECQRAGKFEYQEACLGFL